MRFYHFLLFYLVSIVVWIAAAYATLKMNSKLGRKLDSKYFPTVSIAGVIVMMIIAIEMFYFQS